MDRCLQAPGAADVNNDGKVDSKDAVEILKTYAKNLVGNKN